MDEVQGVKYQHKLRRRSSRSNNIIMVQSSQLHKSSNLLNLVIWSAESKFKVFESDGKPYVRRPILKELNSRFTRNSVKHCGSSVRMWLQLSKKEAKRQAHIAKIF